MNIAMPLSPPVPTSSPTGATAIPNLPRLVQAGTTVATELHTAFRAMLAIEGVIPSAAAAERLAAGMPGHAENVGNLGRILVKYAGDQPQMAALGARLLADANDIRQVAAELPFLSRHDVPISGDHIEPFENATRDTIDAVKLLRQLMS